MNRLQIIQEIFGDKFCPALYINGNTENYSARMKDVNWLSYLSPFTISDIMSRAKNYNARIGVDFYRNQFDVYFN